jgi:hypothetical protein
MNCIKQRTAIAEYLGYIDVREYMEDMYIDYLSLMGRKYRKGPLFRIPDYLNDLNAMHEVEKHLVDNFTTQDFQIARYVNHLENLVSSNVPKYGWSFALTAATAAQKTEAFLKTIGKWE